MQTCVSCQQKKDPTEFLSAQNKTNHKKAGGLNDYNRVGNIVEEQKKNTVFVLLNAACWEKIRK